MGKNKETIDSLLKLIQESKDSETPEDLSLDQLVNEEMELLDTTPVETPSEQQIENHASLMNGMETHQDEDDMQQDEDDMQQDEDDMQQDEDEMQQDEDEMQQEQDIEIGDNFIF
jgi:hypothetical protein